MKLAIFALVFAGMCLAQFPVNGRIVDDIDGQPVVNAQVGLLGDVAPAPVRTDAEGRFSFSVAGGKYKLAVEKAGYLPYPKDTVDVRDGAPGDLALVLTRTRSITARLVWPDGEPVARIAVSMRSLKRIGQHGLGGEEEVPRPFFTNELYFSGLPPGQYILLLDPLLVPAPNRRGVPTQYPSSEAVERGDVIDLRFTATRDLGTITVTEAAGVEVSGRFEVTEKIAMTNFGGSQKSYPSIDLITPDGTVVVAHTNGQPDGTFRFPKVAPGTYYLLGNTQIPNYVTFGVQEIQVGATPVSGIVMALPDEPPTITGRFEVETSEGVAVPPGMSVGTRFTRPATISPRRPADAEGKFSIYVPTGPGGPVPNLQLHLLNRFPADTYIASVTQGQATYTRDPSPIVVNGEPVHVLFKQDGATIRGQVPISGNLPYPPFIVLAPKERDAAFYYRTATTDHTGAFQLQAIAPGTYDLFAFDREANYSGQQTLRAYQDAAVSVTVAAGESLTVNPNVVRIEK